MRYMLLDYLDEQALDETAREECYVESAPLRCTLRRRRPVFRCATASDLWPMVRLRKHASNWAATSGLTPKRLTRLSV